MLRYVVSKSYPYDEQPLLRSRVIDRLFGVVQIPKPVSQPDRQWLLEIASDQAGYVTAAQARACGFSWA